MCHTLLSLIPSSENYLNSSEMPVTTSIQNFQNLLSRMIVNSRIRQGKHVYLINEAWMLFWVLSMKILACTETEMYISKRTSSRKTIRTIRFSSLEFLELVYQNNKHFISCYEKKVALNLTRKQQQFLANKFRYLLLA